jgi:hypothetical protein
MPGLNDDSVERQELYCHACNGYVRFNIDTALDGNHTIICPNCGHEHYRLVNKGVITDIRWKSSGIQYYCTAATWISSTAYYTTATASTAYTNLYWYPGTIGTGNT